MFRRTALVAAVAAIASVFCSHSLRADDPKPSAPTEEQMQEMMKAWEAAATPGDEHKKLAEMAGNWTCKVEDFSTGQPMTSEGTCKFSMVMDGRYLMQEFTSNMMGMKFDGMGLTGYNNMTKKFQQIWIDSMGTAIYFAQGERKSADTVECSGKMDMPGKGQVDSRTIWTHNDKDHITFEMHAPGMDGKEIMAVKITYTRVK